MSYDEISGREGVFTRDIPNPPPNLGSCRNGDRVRIDGEVYTIAGVQKKAGHNGVLVMKYPPGHHTPIERMPQATEVEFLGRYVKV